MLAAYKSLDYLSEEFMELIKEYCDKAEEENMLAFSENKVEFVSKE